MSNPCILQVGPSPNVDQGPPDTAREVFEYEPDPDPRFLTLDNMPLHPHHIFSAVETCKAMDRLVRNNLTAQFAGQPALPPVF